MDNNYDVIVIGSGLAGLCAGITAAESSAKTLIIEKLDITGGTSRYSFGEYAACCSAFQKKQNIEDEYDIFKNDILSCGGYINNINLVDILVKNSASAFNKLIKWGAEYNKIPFKADGHSVRRCHQPVYNLYTNVITPLTSYYKSLNNTYLITNSNVDSIIFENERAAAVKSGENIYKASHGIIFAAGGFAADVSFLGDKYINYKNIPTSVSSGADSKTLEMLISYNAAVRDLEYLRFGSSVAYNDIEKGILINRDTSKRFISETSSRKELMETIINQCSSWPVLIGDSKIFTDMANEKKFDVAFSKGEIMQFSSLKELSDFYNLDINLLSETINNYNNFVLNRKDEEFNKIFNDNNALTIDTPPFYTNILFPLLTYTQGGVVINEHAQILDNNGNIMHGLYACGEFTGGVYGKTRLTCCSTTECAVFGIIAGTNAASFNM